MAIPSDKIKTGMPWFVIYPYGKWFSYATNDQFKGTGWIISNLTDIVAKGGNFMIGIGPDATGRFAPEAVAAIKEAGAWLRVNGEAISAPGRPLEGRRGHPLHAHQGQPNHLRHQPRLARPRAASGHS
jgi:alpha-L-fucosidase